MKKILLLGGSFQQIPAIKAAKKLNLYTILCDYLPDNPGQFHADKFYQTSTTDKQAILEIALNEKIDFIIAYASDPAAPTAAYIAEKLNLPGNPYESVNTLCNKNLFRKFLAENNFNAPNAEFFDDMEKAQAYINHEKLPLIIKPVDSSGSKGVSVVENMYYAEEAVNLAFYYSRSGKIIIEDFIRKKHKYLIGGDIFVSNGKIILWGLMNCHRDNLVNPLVPAGKSYPVLLDDVDLLNVKNTLQKMIDILGIKFGEMNVELIVDEKNRVFPVDIGPRSGGNMIPDLLGLIFDCNMPELQKLKNQEQNFMPHTTFTQTKMESSLELNSVTK